VYCSGSSELPATTKAPAPVLRGMLSIVTPTLVLSPHYAIDTENHSN